MNPTFTFNEIVMNYTAVLQFSFNSIHDEMQKIDDEISRHEAMEEVSLNLPLTKQIQNADVHEFD